jgi:hypothetical protein
MRSLEHFQKSYDPLHDLNLSLFLSVTVFSSALVRIRTTSSIQSIASWQIAAAPSNQVMLGG